MEGEFLEEEDQFISSRAGFAFFTVSAIFPGLVHLISPYFLEVDESAVASFGCSCFIYVVYTVVFAVGNATGAYLRSWQYLVFVGIFAVVDMVTSCCFYSDYNRSTPAKKHIFWFLLRLGLVLSFAGSFLLAAYFHDIDAMQEYKYVGPMRIVGTDIQLDKFSHFTGSGSGTYEGYRAKFVLEWGDEWACPGFDDNKWCTSSPEYSACTNQNICERKKCDSKQRESAKQKVRHCLSKVHVNVSLLLSDEDGYNFSRSQPPWEDEGWPHAVFYGNCGDCEANEDIRYDRFLSMFDYGRLMVPIGSLIAYAAAAGMYASRE